MLVVSSEDERSSGPFEFHCMLAPCSATLGLCNMGRGMDTEFCPSSRLWDGCSFEKKKRRRRRARVCLSRQFVFSCPHGFQGVQGKICAWTGSWVLKAPLPCSSRSWELRVQNLGCDFITHLHLILDATLESQFAGFRVPRLWQPAPSQFEHREIQLRVRKQQQGLGKVFCILCVGFSSWQSLDCRALFF